MSEKGKYRVNLVKRNDVAKLMSLLKDFKWSPNSLPTNYLIIDVIEKHASKVLCEIYNGHLAEIYRLVTYEKMVEILYKPSYGLTTEKAEMISLKNQKAYMEKYTNGDGIDDIMNFDVNRELKIFKENADRATKDHEKETLKQNIEILNDHLLNGTRIQFNCSGDQWHNVTGKFKIEQLKNKSIKFRVRPDRVSIDGYMLTPKQAIDYINRNYDNG